MKRKQIVIEIPSRDPDYQGGWSPGIETEDDDIIDADEIITTRDSIFIKFDYPLSRAVSFSYHKKRPEGFSRRDFYKCILAGYHRIYSEEHKAVGDPGHIPGMLNRQSSEGPYGIWGHDIGDLVLEGVIDNDDGTFDLLIGS
jgi:hypothetical protein